MCKTYAAILIHDYSLSSTMSDAYGNPGEHFSL